MELTLTLALTILQAVGGQLEFQGAAGKVQAGLACASIGVGTRARIRSPVSCPSRAYNTDHAELDGTDPVIVVTLLLSDNSLAVWCREPALSRVRLWW